MNIVRNLVGALPMSIFGLRIQESEMLRQQPKVQLSEACPCSEEFREDFNQWLLEMFGKTPPQMISMGDVIVVSPGFKGVLRKELMESTEGIFYPSLSGEVYGR